MTEYEKLYATIIERRAHPEEGSYTCYLFEQGLDKILKKLGEECAETIIAAKNHNRRELVAELSDLVFHMEVLMAQQGVAPEEIEAELGRRAQKTGNRKPLRIVDKNT
ncbi:MAG: phosphoribosyl-ATP diphosphatase [Oscillospiraceae bacterium]|jgi:phosphoribosyl-ATP pyrophosphohydrolase|nr:phosphoribosyl-ATP diphosphatase [Oscillospiraceae bacterium]